MKERPETVISGSFRKYMELIGNIKKAFENAGVKVLAPMTEETINPGDAFVLLATDDAGTPPTSTRDELHAGDSERRLFVRC